MPLALKHSVTDAKTLQDAVAHMRLWVAVNSTGRPVGFALADVLDGQAHLDEIGVLPNFGRCGIGTRLVQTVRDWASKEGFSELTLVTFSHLPWNAPFYRQLGFEVVSPDERKSELREQIDAEAAAGIDISKRVGMKLSLRNGNDQSL